MVTVPVPPFQTKYRAGLENALSELFAERRANLYEMMRHQMGWDGDALVAPGKYLRPGMLLQTCESCGGDWGQALPGAIALELLHNFSLIHDDIQDESPLRRRRPTVWNRWGAAQAINAGDGMYALSRLALLDLSERGVEEQRVFLAARLLDETCLALCEGQYMDLAFQERNDVTLLAYESMIGNKTAAVFQCALEMGALIAVGRGPLSNALAAAGREMGLAYQMRDDVLDLWGGAETGKELALDIRRGKKSLPVVYGLSRGDTAPGRRLNEIYSQALDDAHVGEVLSLLKAVDAPAFCADAADQHWRSAQALLHASTLSTANIEALLEAGEFIVNRSF